MIPALDTFENMRECLGAISVTLPIATDLLSAQPSKSQRNGEKAAAARLRSPATISRLISPSKAKSRYQDLRRCRKTSSVNQTPVNRGAKAWNSCFAAIRTNRTRPYMEALEGLHCAIDPLVVFANGFHDSTPSWEAHTLMTFCQGRFTPSTPTSDSAYKTEQRAWYWRTSSPETGNPGWVPLSDLGYHMWAKVA